MRWSASATESLDEISKIRLKNPGFLVSPRRETFTFIDAEDKQR
jgi:hypothetical protein